LTYCNILPSPDTAYPLKNVSVCVDIRGMKSARP
jgi:hypothetical protein